MKKFMFMLLMFCLVFSLSVPVMAEDVPENIPPFMQFAPAISADTGYLFRAGALGLGGSFCLADLPHAAMEIRVGFLDTQKDLSDEESMYWDLTLGLRVKDFIEKLAGNCPICEAINPTLSLGAAVPADMDFSRWDIVGTLAILNVKFGSIPLIE